MGRPLSAESTYNELTGSEVKDILLMRFADLLDSVSDFQNHLTLPRVRMLLSVKLEVHGRTPPTITINDEVVLRINSNSPSLTGPGTDFSRQLETELVINADSGTVEGMAPDAIRVEHSLPISVPTRSVLGIQDVPTVMEGGTYLKPELIGRTLTVTLDHGPARNRTGQEGLNNMGILAEKRTGTSPDVPIQQEFRQALKEGQDEWGNQYVKDLE